MNPPPSSPSAKGRQSEAPGSHPPTATGALAVAAGPTRRRAGNHDSPTLRLRSFLRATACLNRPEVDQVQVERGLLRAAARALGAKDAGLWLLGKDGQYLGVVCTSTNPVVVDRFTSARLAHRDLERLLSSTTTTGGGFVRIPGASPGRGRAELIHPLLSLAAPRASTHLDLLLLRLAGPPAGLVVIERARPAGAPSDLHLEEALGVVVAEHLAAMLARRRRAGPLGASPSTVALGRERRLLRGLLAAGASMHEPLTLDEVLQRIAEILAQAAEFEATAIYILDQSTGLLHPRAIVGVAESDARRMRSTPVAMDDYRPLMQPSMLVSRSYLFDHRRHQMPMGSILDSALTVPALPPGWRRGQWHPLDSLTIPLEGAGGQPLGLISLDQPRDRLYPNRATVQSLELFADQCAAAISRTRLYHYMEQLAMTDSLTGLHNRRALDEAMARDLARANRSGRPYSVLFCDLDHFKDVNDNWGHRAGDQILEQVAALLRQRLRRGDFAARCGGDEFVLLLPDTNLTEAVAVAEDVRNRAAHLPAPSSVTISIGAAELADGEEDGSLLLARADAAMYAAKVNGRNRVGTSPRSPLLTDATRRGETVPVAGAGTRG